MRTSGRDVLYGIDIMNHILAQLIGQRRRVAVCGLLGLLSVFSLGLVGSQLVLKEPGGHAYLFLVWNLFLAWIPLGVALVAYELHRREQRGWKLFLLGSLWLLFFPNAPYIISDLVHLGYRRFEPDGFAFWHDLVTLATFAWTGLLLGYASLYLMQTIVREKKGRWWGWIFSFSVLGLSGFAIYLGRFGRWNSWDVLHTPLSLLTDIAHQVMHPFSHQRTWGITLLFGSMLILFYVVMYGFLQLVRENQKRHDEGLSWQENEREGDSRIPGPRFEINRD